MTTALTLPTLSLSEDEERAAAGLRAQLLAVSTKNQIKSDLYETKRKAEDLGIAAPDGLPELVNAVLGWPGTVVDVLEERLDWLGWSGENQALDEIFEDNHLNVESSQGHIDALVYGCGFVTVGRGGPGEPAVLVSVESTESCTVEWDYRLRRAKSGLSQTRDRNGTVVMETLYLPDETISFKRVLGRMVVTTRDPHKLGRVPVARLVNRQRASDVDGRSEITRGVEYLTYAALRTLCGLEINREFYTTPKWTATNTDPEVFGMSDEKSPAENKKAGWTATAGRLNAIPPQEDVNGDPIEPKLQEFRPAPPTPYIDQIKMYAQLLGTEAGFPASYLGFATDNPPSADSIRQLEARLVKRAERRQASFGMGWREVAHLALLIRDGVVNLGDVRKATPKWRDAAIPTRAAAADEVMKYVAAEVLRPDSPVTWDRAGFSPEEQAKLAADRQSSAVTELVNGIRGAASTAKTDPTVADLSGRTVADTN